MATALDASTRRRARHVARSAPGPVPWVEGGLGPLCLGAAIALVGAWAAVAPYAGPRMGFHMDAAGAWQWSTVHMVLSLVPGAVAFAAGLALVLSARRLGEGTGRAVLLVAGAATVLAGVWLVFGPFVWPVVTSNPAPFSGGTARHRLLVQGAASLAPGLALVLGGGIALGLARRPHAVAAGDELAGQTERNPYALPFEAVPSAPSLEVPPWPRASEAAEAVAATSAASLAAGDFDWLNGPAEPPPEAWTPEPVGLTAGAVAVGSEYEAAPVETEPADARLVDAGPVDAGPATEAGAPSFEEDASVKPRPLVDDLPVWGPPEVRFEPEVWSPGPLQTSTRGDPPTATYSTRPGMHRPPPGWHRPDLTEPPRSR